MGSGLDFSFEQRFWQQGKQIVVGVDEVGRGPLAGPVVVSAVALSSVDTPVIGIQDSKKIPKKKHSKLVEELGHSGIRYSIGVGSVEQINTLGIVGALQVAIYQAFAQIEQYDQVIIDGIPFKESLRLNAPIEYVVKGDSQSYAIAAASLLAKQYRDQLMAQLSISFPHYGWEKNAGYGTAQHRQAITAHGITPHHRTLFVRNIVS